MDSSHNNYYQLAAGISKPAFPRRFPSPAVCLLTEVRLDRNPPYPIASPYPSSLSPVLIDYPPDFKLGLALGE